MPVIDASVYVALVNADEQDHQSSWAWFEQAVAAEDGIVAPAILLAEVAAALDRGVGDPALVHRALRQLAGSEVIELIPVSLATAERAAVIAADRRLRGCDAVYVALADQLDTCLMTLDRQQLERGTALVTVQAP